MKNLYRITLDTNPEDCNLNCMMCEEHSKYSRFKQELYSSTGTKARRMPSHWIDNIFKEAANLGVQEIIPSTMGEPLMYKDIDKFFYLAKMYNIKINLTTNGTFPKKTIKEWAEMIIPVTIDTKISLNGITKDVAEKIMQGIDFNEHISNIRALIQYRDSYYKKSGFYSRITLQLTFMQNNMHQLPDIIKLAASLGVDRIKGHHLWTHFEEIKKLSFKYDKESIDRWNEIVDKAKDAIEKYRRPNGNKILLQQVEYLNSDNTKLVPENYSCPFLGKELWVSATGKISPCCAPDKMRDSLGDFGNYNDTTFNDVLKSKTYNELLQNYKSKPLCKTCVMRKRIHDSE